MIIVALTILFAFAPDGEIVREVRASHSAAYAGKVVNKFDQYLPEDIRRLFADWPNEPANLRGSGSRKADPRTTRPFDMRNSRPFEMRTSRPFATQPSSRKTGLKH